jgi:hypothetical protein
MCAKTFIKENNGYFIKCESSPHNTPYNLVEKKPDKFGNKRQQDVYDLRNVNKDVPDITSDITPRREEIINHMTPGFDTFIDFKAWHDSFNTSKKDREILVTHTPLGKRIHACAGYGHKRVAYHGQKCSNIIAEEVGNMIAIADDNHMQHNPDADEDELIDDLRKLFDVCVERDVLLNKEKFIPFALGSEFFGLRFEKKLDGTGQHSMTRTYYSKCIKLQRPKTGKELKTAQGILGFVNSYLPNFSKLNYFLNILGNSLQNEKHEIDWDSNPQASEAWNQIMELVKKDVKLHLPQKGKPFAVISDSSKVAYGGALVQKQFVPEFGEERFVLIDLYSKQWPKHQSMAHSQNHELRAICDLVKHWSMYLLMNHFYILTDHRNFTWILNKDDIYNRYGDDILRMIVFLSKFPFTLLFSPAEKSIVLADGISRGFIDIETFRVYQPPDNSFKTMSDEEYKIESDKIGNIINCIRNGNWKAAYYGSSYQSKKDLNQQQMQKILKYNHYAINTIRSKLIRSIQVNNNSYYTPLCNISLLHIRNEMKEDTLSCMGMQQQYDSFNLFFTKCNEFYNLINQSSLDISSKRHIYVTLKNSIRKLNYPLNNNNNKLLTMQTRSKTKAIIEQKQQQNRDLIKESTEEEEFKLKYEDYTNNIDHLTLVDNVLESIFGHYSEFNIFDCKSVRDLQRKDDIGILILKFIQNETDTRKSQELIDLQFENEETYNYILARCFSVDKNNELVYIIPNMRQCHKEYVYYMYQQE